MEKLTHHPRRVPSGKSGAKGSQGPCRHRHLLLDAFSSKLARTARPAYQNAGLQQTYSAAHPHQTHLAGSLRRPQQPLRSRFLAVAVSSNKKVDQAFLASATSSQSPTPLRSKSSRKHDSSASWHHMPTFRHHLRATRARQDHGQVVRMPLPWVDLRSGALLGPWCGPMIVAVSLKRLA